VALDLALNALPDFIAHSQAPQLCPQLLGLHSVDTALRWPLLALH
jgi:hypothetical protein